MHGSIKFKVEKQPLSERQGTNGLGWKDAHVVTCFSSMAVTASPRRVNFWPYSYRMHGLQNRIPKLLNKLELLGAISTMFFSLYSSLWQFFSLLISFLVLILNLATSLVSQITNYYPLSAVTCSTNSSISDPEKLVKKKQHHIFSLTSSCS